MPPSPPPQIPSGRADGRGLDAVVLHQVLRLRAMPTLVGWVTAVGWVLVVGGLDSLTGDNLTFALFYLPAIALAAWVCGGQAGILVATLSALMGFTAARLSPDGPSVAVDLANALFRWVFFLVFAYGSTLLRHLVEALESRATSDELTGLDNRRAFYERVEVDRQRAARNGRPLTVLYVDLDNLKVVNDERGHEGGDELLQLFADRVRSVLRPSDWFARLGGDEFAIALVDTDAEGAHAFAERLRDALAEPSPSGLRPTGSVGCATFLAVPDSVEAMVQAADRLMYEAKQAERGSVRYASVAATAP